MCLPTVHMLNIVIYVLEQMQILHLDYFDLAFVMIKKLRAENTSFSRCSVEKMGDKPHSSSELSKVRPRIHLKNSGTRRDVDPRITALLGSMPSTRPPFRSKTFAQEVICKKPRSHSAPPGFRYYRAVWPEKKPMDSGNQTLPTSN
ncbi:unnamed protein product, partial [Mesorhabditis spiculigera]